MRKSNIATPRKRGRSGKETVSKQRMLKIDYKIANCCVQGRRDGIAHWCRVLCLCAGA